MRNSPILEMTLSHQHALLLEQEERVHRLTKQAGDALAIYRRMERDYQDLRESAELWNLAHQAAPISLPDVFDPDAETKKLLEGQ